MKHSFTTPPPVVQILFLLKQAGFDAFIVGGCVRDMLLGITPSDWDIATSATPTQIQELFPDSVYENDFGTVGVKTRVDDPALAIVEVTTFRTESSYGDNRHPDQISFAHTIEEDLSRRDFTVNAIAASLDSAGKFEIVDPYGGSLDLKKKIIRTVGNPIDRFQEDALRLLRSARFSVQLDFSIDPTTASAVREKSELLGAIAAERIRDEISKILLTSKAAEGIYLLEELQLLRYIFPELREGISCGQNKHHIYSVFEHNVRALAYTVQQQYSLTVRLAALLHDVGKPRVKRGDGPDSTFYNHDIVGGKMARTMLERLHFPKEVIRDVSHLVRHHLFYYNVGEVTEAGVRRFLARVGLEYIDDLLKVREADRIGSGVPKAVPYKTRHLQFMIDKVRHDPLSPKMLKIDGLRIMELTGTAPSPKIGFLLHILLEEVIGDPKKNEAEYLESRVMALSALGSTELEAMSVKAKETQQEFESGEEAEMKKKYYVQ